MIPHPEGGITVHRDAMLRELMALDFMAVDLQLYLNTHPNDVAARNEYNNIIKVADQLRNQYQKLCGPLYSFRSPNIDGWRWLRDPWPWQYSFNVDLPEECC